MKAAVTLMLACTSALILAVTGQARPTQADHLQAPRAAALSSCTIVIIGVPGHIRAAGGSRTGTKYTIAARGMSCSSARPWVSRFTKQQDTAQIKGPRGFDCRSFSTAASGDKLLYSGACMRPPHNIPFFEWAPKIPRS